MISKSSRRDTIIVNCQLSIVNCQFGGAAKFQFVCIFHQKAFSAFKHLRNTEKFPPIDGIKTAYRGALSYSAWPTRNQSSSRATTNGR